MKIQLFILVYVLTLSLVFCQEQRKKETIEYPNNKSKEMNNTIDLEKINTHLNLQKNVMPCGDVYDGYDPPYELTKEDFNLMLPLLEKSLFNSGYKIPEYSLFKQKIQEGFGVDIDIIKRKCNNLIL